MISIIGIGNGASNIAKNFCQYPQYDVYLLCDNEKDDSFEHFHYRLESHEDPEEYEKKIPKLTKFFSKVREKVQVFIVGSSYSSIYSLGILEQIKDKEIEIFYIKPDIELLTGIPKLLENTTFGILQEYARSGVFSSFTIISNLHLENALGGVPIKTYYETLNSSIFSTVHFLNYFYYNEPELGAISKPAPINRIRTIGRINPIDLEESWFFELDSEREVCYYVCINEEKLKTDSALHKKIVSRLKDKPRNAFRKVSYAVYETEHSQDFGFCVAHTNVVQQQKTLDKLDQE